ncbi:MAG TPA: hypothetical protein VF103_00205, partial [Polyangiaceae bacterium]
MKHHEKNRFGVLVASLLGTLGIPACGSSASEPHTTGGPGASGGSSAAGGSGTTCPPDVTPVVRQATEAGNEGGA